jgi:hypothetical protein
MGGGECFGRPLAGLDEPASQSIPSTSRIASQGDADTGGERWTSHHPYTAVIIYIYIYKQVRGEH